MADWPMAGANPQRTSFQATETLLTTWSRSWQVQQHKAYVSSGFRDTCHHQCGAIVSNGHVLIANLMGRVRSYATGTTQTLQWTATAGAPIMSTPCADGTNVYVADIYGRLSAFNLSTGAAAAGWTNPVQVTDGRPIQGHLLLADGKLIIGGADGVLYGRSLANGAHVWSYTVGSPILQGAAWSNATGTGTVVVGAMNGRTYGINSASGGFIWQTGVFPWAAAFKDYWPVIVGSKVVTRPWMQIPETGFGFTSPVRGLESSDILDATQTSLLSAYDANPSAYMPSLRVYDLATGNEQPAPIHWFWRITMNGANPPPCVDRDGYIIIPCAHPTNGSGWARLNLGTRKVVDRLIDAANPSRGGGNRDENMCVAACSNGIVALHQEEANSQYSGFYAQPSNSWYPANGTGSTFDELFLNTQGGNTAPGAISGGMVYHLRHPHTLTALRTV